ncbi:hypothetical protein [Gimesia fumaroli]|uniref:Doubled CXXCH motif n=1 Tax=Gimesia fumaroli TaxID=2527976 RepID=A0A518I9H0_9PLAN|nr:hypothetical protein [Gimesia fumaroli]QDV49758.1 Doubled CXXCH motif [Gimesia fumaroli]
MTEPLQPFDWKNSNYERPANTWVCGRLCEEGLPCRLGPSNKGECQLQSQCEPAEKGGKYQCTRSVLNGGKCKEGPAPDGTCCQPDTSCQPRRSLLARRRFLGGLAAFIAASFCLIVFSGDSPSSLLSPGEVSQSHANIESSCSACHTAAEGGLDTWIHLTMNGDVALDDSARCLKCHTELGEKALFAHSVSIERLHKITSQIQAKKESASAPIALQLASLTGHPATNGKLACSTCHQEHHGRKTNLTQLTDLQCQSCHTSPFLSFQHGHPALGDYPYQRRSRIYFDHNAHMSRYFKNGDFKRTMPKGHKPESCNSCHTPDATGRLMLTAGFEKTCASCHEPQIEDVDFPGVPFFALPVIAPTLMKSQGVWPNTEGSFATARLPRLMELLLEHDSDYQRAIKQLGEIDYRNLNNFDPEKAAAVAEIAWAIKRLLYDISTSGEAALTARLGKNSALYLHLKPSIVPTLSQAQQIWFPNLATEIKYHSEKKAIPDSTQQKPVSAGFSARNANSGWSISDSDFTIRYRPIGHADPLIKGWLDQAVQENQQSLDRDSMWRIFSNPTASGTEDSHGALASGRCLMCHSVDKDPVSGRSHINWQPLPTQQSKAEQFTQFSHAPHLSSGQKLNCESCHVFDPLGTDSTTILQSDYFVRDQSNLFWQINQNSQQACTSGFQPISRQNCSTCHNAATATQSCLQCHNYHAHRQLTSSK